ncbi:hypothetical protein [Actinoplanes sp. L3-i22]|uniref:hypothetical protein n=1 Tax=Actinoplanes sp. L3-i22 TaxID=2836373 RepID=UPI001C76FAE9|nr:hypothetical protein [Actinoplanes sp. L3-i22]BCY08734.1 hypothetical protein L3i22_038220 [Actinoplanes sp. L3-i22]
MYPFIEAEQAGKHNVKRACELLQVSRSAYYQHAGGEQSARDRVDAQMRERGSSRPIRWGSAAMGALIRFRLASPFILISMLFLLFTGAGIWINWNMLSPIHHALSAVMCLMFAVAVGYSISIGFDRSGRIPWWRMGVVVVVIAMALGVAWVRDMV